LRNNYTSLMCASYMANYPYENVARSPNFKEQNIQTTNNLDGNRFSLSKMRSDIHKLKPQDLGETIIEKTNISPQNKWTKWNPNWRLKKIINFNMHGWGIQNITQH
jgi:hypothetical protein